MACRVLFGVANSEDPDQTAGASIYNHFLNYPLETFIFETDHGVIRIIYFFNFSFYFPTFF